MLSWWGRGQHAEAPGTPCDDTETGSGENAKAPDASCPEGGSQPEVDARTTNNAGHSRGSGASEPQTSNGLSDRRQQGRRKRYDRRDGPAIGFSATVRRRPGGDPERARGGPGAAGLPFGGVLCCGP
ncbi:hypothetical protein GCM10010420_38420 [Streptomyces glaucosporus]|uniref:Uncharacterized protein n=1 Tax=Streptomyces glaucosporus TaxID=284044 RepID=A0ABN3ILG8_9ACTN